MKISNETKIGALTSIAIVLLILGFNFLKGKSFTDKNLHFFARFDNIQGLNNSNPVVINGKQVGTVSSTDGGRDMRQIIVSMRMSQVIDIPDNSVAIINPSLLGTTSLEIKLGSSNTFYKDGDTISTKGAAGMFDEALQRIDPVLFEVKKAVTSLDSLLIAVNGVFNESNKNNFKGIMENLNKTTASLAVTASSLQTMMNNQTGSVAKTMDNLNSFTGTLAKNSDNMNQTFTNLNKASSNFANLDLQKTMANLEATALQLNLLMAKMNSQSGTLGKLINDPALYNNLKATSNKVNTLIDDLRTHPKRYVSFSLFGKKDKSDPLKTPDYDSLDAPYKH